MYHDIIANIYTFMDPTLEGKTIASQNEFPSPACQGAIGTIPAHPELTTVPGTENSINVY